MQDRRLQSHWPPKSCLVRMGALNLRVIYDAERVGSHEHRADMKGAHCDPAMFCVRIRLICAVPYSVPRAPTL